jgi:hypothetical protein
MVMAMAVMDKKNSGHKEVAQQAISFNIPLSPLLL